MPAGNPDGAGDNVIIDGDPVDAVPFNGLTTSQATPGFKLTVKGIALLLELMVRICEAGKAVPI